MWVRQWFQQICCSWEKILPGKLAPSIVGHVPRELSQYALRYDATITAEVKDEDPKRSPLVQGGLEIVIQVFIVWDDAFKMKKIKQKLENAQTIQNKATKFWEKWGLM